MDERRSSAEKMRYLALLYAEKESFENEAFFRYFCLLPMVEHEVVMGSQTIAKLTSQKRYGTASILFTEHLDISNR